jgi:hypothetical protein
MFVARERLDRCGRMNLGGSYHLVHDFGGRL